VRIVPATGRLNGFGGHSIHKGDGHAVNPLGGSGIDHSSRDGVCLGICRRRLESDQK
jgi:hypothetical protein